MKIEHRFESDEERAFSVMTDRGYYGCIFDMRDRLLKIKLSFDYDDEDKNLWQETFCDWLLMEKRAKEIVAEWESHSEVIDIAKFVSREDCIAWRNQVRDNSPGTHFLMCKGSNWFVCTVYHSKESC